jgi:hypothetical protein
MMKFFHAPFVFWFEIKWDGVKQMKKARQLNCLKFKIWRILICIGMPWNRRIINMEYINEANNINLNTKTFSFKLNI